MGHDLRQRSRRGRPEACRAVVRSRPSRFRAAGCRRGPRPGGASRASRCRRRRRGERATAVPRAGWPAAATIRAAGCLPVSASRAACRSRRPCRSQATESSSTPSPNRISNPTAVFAGLDKITGRIIKFDVAIDETVRFGALEVTPRACYTRPPTEAPNTDGFVEVDELTLQGELRPHLHRLDVRRKPRAQCGRASDLRRLADRLQRRLGAAHRGGRGARNGGAADAAPAAPAQPSSAVRHPAIAAAAALRIIPLRGEASPRRRTGDRAAAREIGFADQSGFEQRCDIAAATLRRRRTSSDGR
jgi:hypothetical protein